MFGVWGFRLRAACALQAFWPARGPGLGVWGFRPATGSLTSEKLEASLRTGSAGIPFALLLRIEIGFLTFGLLLYFKKASTVRPLEP